MKLVATYHIDAAAVAQEIASAKNQHEAADVYASAIFLVYGGDTAFWSVVNAAIVKRWPKGLQRVKEKAWKLYEERHPKKAPGPEARE